MVTFIKELGTSFMKTTTGVSTVIRRKAALFGASALAMMLASPAFAQDADSAPTPDDVETADVTSAPAQDQVITVTGSRIAGNNEFTSSSPVSVIDPQVGLKQGQNSIAELVQSSPIASGSSQVTAAISSAFVTNGGAGTETISLRGLGAERTLVLLNGRRAGPAGTRGAVAAFDLNVLPSSIVSRIDVLKDGASSIYGSDAVAGVVNVYTKKKTDGLELTGFVSAPTRSAGETYNLSGAWGTEWDGGHILLAGDYFKRTEIKRRDRKYLECEEDYIFTESGARADIIDPRTGAPRCTDLPWGHVWLYDLTYYYGETSNIPGSPGTFNVVLFQYSYPGENLGQYLTPIPAPSGLQIGTPPGWFPVSRRGNRNSFAVYNNYGPIQAKATFSPSVERYTAYADAAVELGSFAEFYFEGLFNRRESKQDGFRQFWQFGVNETFGDPLSAGWTGAALISPTLIADTGDSAQRVNYYRGVAGLRGDFGEGFLGGDWNWDSYFQFSRSDGKYFNEQILADSIATQDFRFGSCVGTFSAIEQKPCVDVRWVDPFFLRGELTQAERDFLFGEETGSTKYDQYYAEASASGTLFELPAGKVGVALGVAYRRDSINDLPGDITYALTPGGDPNNPDDYTNNAWGSTASGNTRGHSSTKEAFGEIRLPLIHNTPFIQNFTLTGAARVTSVKSVRTSDGLSDKDSGNWTYKLGANWDVNDWLSFRGTYGTSFRAPALFEQFLADQTAFLNQRNVDPCINWGINLADGLITQEFADNCRTGSATLAPVPAGHTGAGIEATIITGGGIGVLNPETSKAKTASIILKPKFGFLPDTRFRFALDYFDIEVNGEIAQFGAGAIVAGCYASEFFPTDPLCSLFERGQEDTNGNTISAVNIDFVRDSFINVASQRNKGFDLASEITHDMGSWGKLRFNSTMTWQTFDQTAIFAGTPDGENGELGEPKWVGDFNLSWTKGNFELFYGLDVIGSTNNEADFIDDNGSTCLNSATFGRYCVDVKTPTVFYHSASLSVDIMEKFRATLGVSNLFDRKPPRVSGLASGEVSLIGRSAFASQYDYVGRRVFVNIGAKF
jgi:iron complex outermembrane receptor protein